MVRRNAAGGPLLVFQRSIIETASSAFCREQKALLFLQNTGYFANTCSPMVSTTGREKIHLLVLFAGL